MTNQLSFYVSHVSEQTGKKIYNDINWNLESTMLKFASSTVTVKCNRLTIFKYKCTASCMEVINRLPWLISCVCLKFMFPFNSPPEPEDFMPVYGGSHFLQILAS